MGGSAQALSALIANREVPRAASCRACSDSSVSQLLRSLDFFAASATSSFGRSSIARAGSASASAMRCTEGRGRAQLHIVAQGRGGGLSRRAEGRDARQRHQCRSGMVHTSRPAPELRKHSADVVASQPCTTISFTPETLAQVGPACRHLFDEAFIRVPVRRLHAAHEASPTRGGSCNVVHRSPARPTRAFARPPLEKPHEQNTDPALAPRAVRDGRAELRRLELRGPGDGEENSPVRPRRAGGADAGTALPPAGCEAQAMEKKLAGAAKTSFMKKCEADAGASSLPAAARLRPRRRSSPAPRRRASSEVHGRRGQVARGSTRPVAGLNCRCRARCEHRRRQRQQQQQVAFDHHPAPRGVHLARRRQRAADGLARTRRRSGASHATRSARSARRRRSWPAAGLTRVPGQPWRPRPCAREFGEHERHRALEDPIDAGAGQHDGGVEPRRPAQRGAARHEDDQRQDRLRSGRRRAGLRGSPWRGHGLAGFWPGASACRWRAPVPRVAVALLEEVDPQSHAQGQVLALREDRVDAVGRRAEVLEQARSAPLAISSSTSQVLRQARPEAGAAPGVQHLAVRAVRARAGAGRLPPSMTKAQPRVWLGLGRQRQAFVPSGRRVLRACRRAPGNRASRRTAPVVGQAHADERRVGACRRRAPRSRRPVDDVDDAVAQVQRDRHLGWLLPGTRHERRDMARPKPPGAVMRRCPFALTPPALTLVSGGGEVGEHALAGF